MQNCIENIKKNNNDCIDYDEIIALKKVDPRNIQKVTDKTNVLEYGLDMFRKMHLAILKDIESKDNDIKNTIHCVVRNEYGLESWLNIFSTEKGRKEVIGDGELLANEFIEKHSKTA